MDRLMTEVAVLGEQVRSLYRRGIAAFVTNVVNAAILAALLWGEASHDLLGGWFVAIASASVGRFVLHRRYWRAPFVPDDAPRWGRWFAVGSAFSGSA